jgi:hypothetical protein
MVIISGFIILKEKYGRFKKRIDDITKRLERLEKNLSPGQDDGHLIEDSTTKRQTEFFKKMLTGSQ